MDTQIGGDQRGGISKKLLELSFTLMRMICFSVDEPNIEHLQAITAA